MRSAVGFRSGRTASGAAALLLLVLAGCAGGDDDDAIGTSSAVVEGLETAPAAAPAADAAQPIPASPVSADLATGASYPAPDLRLTDYVAPLMPAEALLRPAATDAEAATAEAATAEAARLSAEMAREVPDAVRLSPMRRRMLIALAQRMAAEDHLFIRRPQLVLIVDRAPAAQLLAMTLARPDGAWEILGAAHVSTGKPGRREHFRTPVGVLLNDGSELGYRALGTYNQNHIRGLGVKGMRVWDFGWQTTDDWRTPGATMQVRVEMHATDPSVLEQRLGRADSEGCIRLPDAVNRFLDRHGIIDADIERLGETDGGYRALLSPALRPTPLAGDAIIVVDSSEPWSKPYPPQTTVALGD